MLVRVGVSSYSECIILSRYNGESGRVCSMYDVIGGISQDEEGCVVLPGTSGRRLMCHVHHWLGNLT